MDTSKEYIEMCRKADEIQHQWNEDTRQEGDFFIENGSIDVFYNCPEEDNLTYAGHPIWLPRQDQLMNMISVDWFEVWDRLWDFITEEGGAPGESELYLDDSIKERYESHCQLLLDFVMRTNYNQRWTGSEWKQVV